MSENKRNRKSNQNKVNTEKNHNFFRMSSDQIAWFRMLGAETAHYFSEKDQQR